MKLIIFGPPGSGKGTYSSKLKEIFGVEKIATGDIFREEIKKGSKLGKKVEKYVKEGKLVPDEIVIEVVKERIKNLENFILDGFPRTVNQAKELLKLTKIDAIIKLNMHEEILVEKMLGRRICSNPKCDGNYNVANIHKVVEGIEYYLPALLPKNDMKCDKCGSPLIQREDDKEEIIRQRIKIYEEQTKPVLEFFKKETKIPIIEIWVNRPVEEIVNRLVEELKKLKI